MNVFMASGFTGQSNYGVYSTLALAKSQFDVHQAEHKEGCPAQWVLSECGYIHTFQCADYPVCGLIENGMIVEVFLNEDFQ